MADATLVDQKMQSIRYDYSPGMGEPPIPEHMRDSIQNYIERGVPVGDFLTALLSNDLMEAVGRADEWNRRALYTWVCFLYNEAPRGCYGSPEKVKEWQRVGGLLGLAHAIETA